MPESRTQRALRLNGSGQFPYQQYVERLLEVSRSGRKRRITQVRSVAAGTPSASRDTLQLEELKAEAAEDKAVLQHKFNLIEEEQKHKYRVIEDELETDQEIRKELLKRALDEKKDEVELRAKEAQIRLNDAQTSDLLSKGEREAWRAKIDLLKEKVTQQYKYEFEQTQQDNRLVLEQFKQNNRFRIEELKAKLEQQKPKEESTFEQFERLKDGGEFRTFGDVAKFWMGRGKKAEDVQTLVKMELRAAGVDPKDFFGHFGEDEKEWQEVFRTPFPVAEKDPESAKLQRQFKNRVQAERFLHDRVADLKRRGVPEAELGADESAILDVINRTYPDQPSVYHQLISLPSTEPTPDEVYDRMKQDLKGIMSRASAGVAGELKAAGEDPFTELDSFIDNLKAQHQKAAESRGTSNLEYIRGR